MNRLQLAEIEEIEVREKIKTKAWLQDMEGYEVITDTDTFQVLIEADSSCCEVFGYITSEDDLQYFVGKELLEVSTTDTELNHKILEKLKDDNVIKEEIQFVTFTTNVGAFQLAVYNSHNGYYGHNILIKQNDTILIKNNI